ncbi:hypothetical protein GQ600_14787 [Phytophthora cactorum]|nr:hypothetical protein GQ600_14787 [Phytophthora cactorum]
MVVVEAYLACRYDMTHVATLDFPGLPLIYNDLLYLGQDQWVSTMDVDGEYIRRVQLSPPQSPH